MKEKLFTGLCLLVRLITWGILLLAVTAIAIPIIERFHVYQRLFLSRIKNTPQQRYEIGRAHV